jgi:hypothetical protein
MNLKKISAFFTAMAAVCVLGGSFGLNNAVFAEEEVVPIVPERPVIAQTAPTNYTYADRVNGTSVNVTLLNNSIYTAKNVVVSRSITDQFAAEVGAGGGPFDLAAGASRTIPVYIMPDDDVPGGRYQITLDVTYQDVSGTANYSYLAVVYISVPELPAWETPDPNAVVNPILLIEDMSVTPGGEDNFAGNDFTVSGVVRNWSDTDALTAEIIVTGGIGTNAIGLPDASSRVFLGRVPSWGFANFSFTFRSDENLAGGIYPITFEAACTNQKGEAIQGDPLTYSVRIVENPNAGEEEEKAAPILTAEGFTVNTKNVTYGTQFTISGNVQNSGDETAVNTQIKVTADSLQAGAVELPNATTSKNLGNIDGEKSTAFSFTFYANEKIESGSYPITFEVSAQNSESRQFTYSVRINGKPEEQSPPKDAVLAKLTSSVTQPSGSYDVSGKFDMIINFTNTGKSAATAIKVTAAEASGAVVPRSASVQQIDSIAPGQTKSLTFSFMPTANVSTQFYTVQFNCEYNAGVYEDADVIETFSQYGGVSIVNSKKDAEAAKEDEEPDDPEIVKSIPKIIVSNYVVTSDNSDASSIVLAGREFDLFLEFKNTHPQKSVSNIKITLTAPQTSTGEQQGNTFSVVGGSNTIFVEEIAPDGITQKTLRMYCVTSAAAKNHIILVNFDYEDEEGNQISQQEEVGVTVTQEDKLEVGNIFLPSAVMQNESVYLNFSLQNTGRVTLYNTKVILEGEGFDLSGSEMIIGNLQSGGYQYYDGSIFGTEAGMHSLKVIIQYDLDSGQRKTVEKFYDVEVMEGGDMGMGGMGGIDIGKGGGVYIDGGMYVEGGDMGMVEGEGGNIIDGFLALDLWLKIVIIGGMVIVLGGIVTGIVLLVKRKRKMDAQFFDE